MKQLSDLLNEAKAEMPPARYDIDDVVAAGRRRRRRRQSGWAAAAAVVAAIGIGVPLAATPSSAPQPAATNGAKAPEKLREPHFTFAAYSAVGFRVLNPTTWTLAGETAEIRKTGRDGTTGALTVYRRGVDPLAGYKRRPTVTGTDPIKGRPASLVDYGADDRDLLWEYADGASAVVRSQDGAMTPDDLRRVAEAFTTGTPREIRIAFRLASIDADYRLVSIFTDPGSGLRSQLTLVPSDVAEARLAEPGRGRAPGETADKTTTVDIRLSTGGPDLLTVPKSTECEGPVCSAPANGGDSELVVMGRKVDQGEMRKVLSVVDVADPAKPDTWWPIDTAVPASVLLDVG
ncbi:hypothetical protein [Paractinoplanes rishiriensis]|uniref:Uncharacterized protein n=1 Tax=Paractinoplanes rishiriensis TaxID=1050105 RepID=A0A919K417_9ACTN|nr:hypothetical protein [Actinoplanes rishiriensis]GIE98178.1 hypothetical protein Ari01nite_56430 [Actinoplanes rishiriensis]